MRSLLIVEFSCHQQISIRGVNDLRVIRVLEGPFNRLGTGSVEQTREESAILRFHAGATVDAVCRRAGSLIIDTRC